MVEIAACALVVSHGLCLLRLWLGFKRGKAPLAAEWVTLSCLLYYDLGLAMEAAGLRSLHFRALLEADRRVLALALLCMGIAPWTVYVGSLVTGPSTRLAWHNLRATRHWKALLLAILLIDLAMLVGITWPLLRTGLPIYSLRYLIGPRMGPLIIVLYVPIGILAFLATRSELTTVWGNLILIGQAAVASAILVPVGQRTLVLIPWLILLISRARASAWRLAVYGALAIAMAAAMLLVFKPPVAVANPSYRNAALNTLGEDLSRTGVLRQALELSPPVGTTVLEYPAAGYRYALLFFAPRLLVPSKGYSTALQFTAYLTGQDVANLRWGYGVGVLEELSLNLGYLLVVPGLLLYGLAYGLLERLAHRWSAAYLPLVLSAVWICGYQISAVLLLHGTIFLVSLGLSVVFQAPSQLSISTEKQAESSCE